MGEQKPGVKEGGSAAVGLARLERKLVLKKDTYLAQSAGSHSCPSKSKKTD